MSPVTRFHAALEELAETARRVSDSVPPNPAGALFGELAHELSDFKARLDQLKSTETRAGRREPNVTMDEARPQRLPERRARPT